MVSAMLLLVVTFILPCTHIFTCVRCTCAIINCIHACKIIVRILYACINVRMHDILIRKTYIAIILWHHNYRPIEITTQACWECLSTLCHNANSGQMCTKLAWTHNQIYAVSIHNFLCRPEGWNYHFYSPLPSKWRCIVGGLYFEECLAVHWQNHIWTRQSLYRLEAQVNILIATASHLSAL